MKRQFSIVVLLLAAACAVIAKPRTAVQLRQEAAKVLSTSVLAKGIHGNTMAEPAVLRQKSQLTVLGYADGGYAVIANDDTFSPVLGYSDAALTDNPAPAFVWWMDAMNESLEKMLATGEQPEKVTPASGYKRSVDELLTTRWDQSMPYNMLCPTYLNGTVETHYVTGCVATSMAQVMNYHKYPVKGKGSKSYFFYPEGSEQRSRAFANFGNTTYDYANMLDVYSGNNYTSEQATAVATLMYHCGVSVEMGYNRDGSGAFSNKACSALRNYFLYDENVKLYMRDYFPVEEWMNIIYRELSDGCPLIYGGATTNNAGHSFVVDGYDENGFVHVNWGWSGSGNGFYDIASLRGYSEGQDMIVVRMPGDNRFESMYTSLWGLGYKLVMTQSVGDLLVSCDGLYNMDIDNFTGEVAVVAADMSTQVITSLGTVRSVSDVEYLHGLRFSLSRHSYAGLSDGTYRIFLATKSEKESSWQAVRSKENLTNSYILVKKGKSVTLNADDNSNWTTGINIAGRVSDGMIRVYNLSGHLVYTAPADGFSKQDIPASGVFILKNGSTAIKIVK